jgi:hypothetical protein
VGFDFFGRKLQLLEIFKGNDSFESVVVEKAHELIWSVQFCRAYIHERMRSVETLNGVAVVTMLRPHMVHDL